MKKIENVQSYIVRVGIPSTLKELERYALNQAYLPIEEIINGTIDNWTAPKWAVPGDIVFFNHTTVSGSKINSLRYELAKSIDSYSRSDYYTMWEYLFYLDDAFNKYGGTIFAVGRVAKRPVYSEMNPERHAHWKSNVYADLSNIFVLKKPIDISSFNSFIKMNTQSSIIPVEGNEFDRLVQTIAKGNKSIRYLAKCKATPFSLRSINGSNWINVNKEYRRRYHLESQFRSYYVDYLLKEIGDKKRIYSECNCYKREKLSGFADNAICIDGKYIFVESKLNMDSEAHLITQLNKYIQVSRAELNKKTVVDKEGIYQRAVLVIDPDRICLYKKGMTKPEAIEGLDNINTKADIIELRKSIIRLIT